SNSDVRTSPPRAPRQILEINWGILIWEILEEWRRGRDSNSRRAFTLAGFQDRCIQPLCHPSATGGNLTLICSAVNKIAVKFLRLGPAPSSLVIGEGGGLAPENAIDNQGINQHRRQHDGRAPEGEEQRGRAGGGLHDSHTV